MSIVTKRLDQDAIWYEGRPRPRPHCIRWGPSSPQKRVIAASQFSAHVSCGQTAEWIKMKLGVKVGLGPGLIVLDGAPVPPPKGHSSQFLSYVCCGKTDGWVKMPLGR